MMLRGTRARVVFVVLQKARTLLSRYARGDVCAREKHRRARVQRKSLDITDAEPRAAREEPDADIPSRMGTEAARHCFFEKSPYPAARE